MNTQLCRSCAMGCTAINQKLSGRPYNSRKSCVVPCPFSVAYVRKAACNKNVFWSPWSNHRKWFEMFHEHTHAGKIGNWARNITGVIATAKQFFAAQWHLATVVIFELHTQARGDCCYAGQSRADRRGTVKLSCYEATNATTREPV